MLNVLGQINLQYNTIQYIIPNDPIIIKQTSSNKTDRIKSYAITISFFMKKN
jgi:hypothetical protein